VAAEIIVTFEGTTEMGNPFMARQSYLPSEIRWGYQFVRCIHRPHGTATRYTVDIAKCAVTTSHCHNGTQNKPTAVTSACCECDRICSHQVCYCIHCTVGTYYVFARNDEQLSLAVLTR